ncbi:MAG: TadG family pilus assembly protein, partial [Candidatus Saccharimonadales bacterium]
MIFALSAVVLFSVMGLAIDAGISYLHSDQQEGAAQAAALSGVSYLPSDFPSAEQEALLTASRNGYVSQGSGNNSTSVAVWQPDSTTNELEVSITAPAPIYFLGILGFSTHEVTAYAIAEYLPPIELGQPGNSLGTVESDVGQPGGEYFLREEGYGNPRSEGDAFTPTPTDSSSGCAGSCSASPADIHQISCISGTDTCSGDYSGLEVNDTGGYSYLIYVPSGTTADVQVYNPSFDPGVDNNSDINSYHDDDSSFPLLSSGVEPPATDYGSMAFTLYAVTNVNDTSQDIPLKEDIFCPFNAYGLESGRDDSYTYYANCNQPGSSVPDAVTEVRRTSSSSVDVFQKWVSLLSYAPTGNNAKLFNASYNNLNNESSYLSDVGGVEYLSGGVSGQYYRMSVNMLAWNGSPINTSNSSPTPSVDSGNIPSNGDGYPLAHDAYALQVVTPSGGSGDCASSSNTCTISAEGEVCIYTPIQNASAFEVPLFLLPAEYAGKTISVRVFDPGDVSGGDAYLGIVQPSYVNGSATYPASFASLASASSGVPEVSNIGTSLGDTTSSAITPNAGSDPGYTFSNTSAVIQTASSSSYPYNGDWVQFNIQVPSNYDPTGSGAYWDLYYQVAEGVVAGDTITVQ